MKTLATLPIFALIFFMSNRVLSQDTLHIYTNPVSVAVGEQFCIDFNTLNFDNILTAQFTVHYDPTVIQITGVANLNLPDLIPSYINTNEPGVVTFAWNSSDVNNGVSMPDNSSLFQLCFLAIGEFNNVTTITFDDIPTHIEFANSNLETLPYNLNGGDVTIGAGLNNLHIANANVTNVSCSTLYEGSIVLEVEGGTPPYNFIWSNGAMTQSISSLSVGQYDVTITDSDIVPVEITGNFTISGDFTSPIISYQLPDTIKCNNPVVEIDASQTESNADIIFLWTAVDGTGIVSGGDTRNPMINEPGQYIFLVINEATNCGTEDTVTVAIDTATINFNINADFSIIDCNHSVLQLFTDIPSTVIGESYIWGSSNGGNIISPTLLLPSASINSSGTYSVTVTNQSNSCTSARSIDIMQDPDQPMANIVTPVDTINCLIPSVTLSSTGSSQGVDFQYEWTTVGGSITSSTDGNTIDVDAQGLYVLKITNTINGCSSSDTVQVLKIISLPTAFATQPNSINCIRDTVRLDGTGSSQGANFQYNWQTTDGHFVSTNLNQINNIVVDQAGDYTLFVTNMLTGCSSTFSVTVDTNLTVPTISAGTDLTLNCMSNNLTLQGTYQGVDPTTTMWTTINGNITGNATTLTPTVNVAGTYILHVTNIASGCEATDAMTVLPSSAQVSADAGEDVAAQCNQGSFTLIGNGSSSSGGEVTFSWSTLGGNIQSGQDTREAIVNGVGAYILLVTDTAGCVGRDTVEVLSNGNLTNSDAGDNISSCENSITLAANAPLGTIGIWTEIGTSALSINENNNPLSQVQISDFGSYQLAWTLSTTECPFYSSDTITVSLVGQPIANNDVSEIPFGEYQLNLPVIANDSIYGTTDYSINLLDQNISGVTLINQNNGTIRVLLSASTSIDTIQFQYEVCLLGCAEPLCDTANVIITTEKEIAADSIFVPNTITPNGDGLNDYFILSILSQHPEKYPNNSIVIFNRWGSEVFSASPYGNNWNGQNKQNKELPEGTYYYVLRLDLGNSIIYSGDITVLRR
ncbi:MAG: gliding motility-associated C-terminal domain-containing protein [Saprospiraceae bacterium]|nr:gliding motility-associated C-terminal domain-containing protein [Saprospiraceae bacterium]